MDDNLYPRSSASLLAPPSEQTLEKEKEANQVQANAPVIRDIITRLDERIAFYSSIDSVPADSITNPDTFMHVVASNKLTRDNLQAEKDFLEELLNTYVK